MVKSPGLYGDLTRCRIGLSSVVFYCREPLIFQKIILVDLHFLLLCA
jgi:hypothetical protein